MANQTLTGGQQVVPGFYLCIPSTGALTAGPFGTSGAASAAITNLPNSGTAVVQIIGTAGVLVNWGCGPVFGTVVSNIVNNTTL